MKITFKWLLLGHAERRNRTWSPREPGCVKAQGQRLRNGSNWRGNRYRVNNAAFRRKQINLLSTQNLPTGSLPGWVCLLIHQGGQGQLLSQTLGLFPAVGQAGRTRLKMHGDQWVELKDLLALRCPLQIFMTPTVRSIWHMELMELLRPMCKCNLCLTVCRSCILCYHAERKGRMCG